MKAFHQEERYEDRTVEYMSSLHGECNSFGYTATQDIEEELFTTPLVSEWSVVRSKIKVDPETVFLFNNSPLPDEQTMARRKDDVMRLCCDLSAHEQISAAVKSSSIGAALAGGVALAGGLLAGSVGIFVGGALGGALGGWWARDQYKPLPQILMELNSTQKKQLYNQLIAVLGNLDWTNAAQLMTLVMTSSSLHQKVLTVLLGYIKNQLHAKVRYQH